jgi:hypothetical protein
MKKKLLVSLFAALLISACAEISENNQNSRNNTGNSFVDFQRLNKTAIYYKNDHIKNIPTGESYWKDKMQQADNQLSRAIIGVEVDLNQDINRLSSIDNDLAALTRCRTIQRDVIKKQFAERQLTLQQAQNEWKKWGNLVRKDSNDMQYLTEVLENTKKIEQSYRTATTAIISVLPPVSKDIQQQWQQELQTQKAKELANAEKVYKKRLTKKYVKPKIKKELQVQHQQKIAEINQQYTVKEAEIKQFKINEAGIEKFEVQELKQKMAELDKQYAIKKTDIKGIEVKEADIKKSEIKELIPKVQKLNLLVASIHEKYESIQKNKEKLDKLAVEAGNDKGFEQITSQLFPILFAHINPLLTSFNLPIVRKS